MGGCLCVSNPSEKTVRRVNTVMPCQGNANARLPIWRLYIDEWRQSINGEGKKKDRTRDAFTFDQGKHDSERKEPGYIESIVSAHEFAFSRNAPMTLEDYREIHRLAVLHKGKKWHTLRDSEEIHMKWSEKEWATYRSSESLEEYKEANRLIDIDKELKVMFFSYETNNPSEILDKIKSVIDEFYASVNKLMPAHEGSKKILLAVAKMHKHLEYLHPYRDGNTRTNLVVLNRVLSDHNLGPVMFVNPNVVYYRSIQDWSEIIVRGCRRAIRYARKSEPPDESIEISKSDIAEEEIEEIAISADEIAVEERGEIEMAADEIVEEDYNDISDSKIFEEEKEDIGISESKVGGHIVEE